MMNIFDKNRNYTPKDEILTKSFLIDRIANDMKVKYKKVFSVINYDEHSLKSDIHNLLSKYISNKHKEINIKYIETTILNKVREKYKSFKAPLNPINSYKNKRLIKIISSSPKYSNSYLNLINTKPKTISAKKEKKKHLAPIKNKSTEFNEKINHNYYTNESQNISNNNNKYIDSQKNESNENINENIDENINENIIENINENINANENINENENINNEFNNIKNKINEEEEKLKEIENIDGNLKNNIIKEEEEIKSLEKYQEEIKKQIDELNKEIENQNQIKNRNINEENIEQVNNINENQINEYNKEYKDNNTNNNISNVKNTNKNNLEIKEYHNWSSNPPLTFEQMQYLERKKRIEEDFYNKQNRYIFLKPKQFKKDEIEENVNNNNDNINNANNIFKYDNFKINKYSFDKMNEYYKIKEKIKLEKEKEKEIRNKSAKRQQNIKNYREKLEEKKNIKEDPLKNIPYEDRIQLKILQRSLDQEKAIEHLRNILYPQKEILAEKEYQGFNNDLIEKNLMKKKELELADEARKIQLEKMRRLLDYSIDDKKKRKIEEKEVDKKYREIAEKEYELYIEKEKQKKREKAEKTENYKKMLDEQIQEKKKMALDENILSELNKDFELEE